jgi:hypothetical protein
MSDDETRAGANPAEPPVPAQAAGDPKFDTEDLLNSLIAECREYVRIIGAHFGDPATDPHVRWQMMERMMELVKTGATVGETVARLRGGATSETRQRIIVERTVRQGEGGRGFPEND